MAVCDIPDHTQIRFCHMAVKFGVFVDGDHRKLPTLYRLPKHYKRQYKLCLLLKQSTAALIRNAKNRLYVHIFTLFSLELFDVRVEKAAVFFLKKIQPRVFAVFFCN